jgi:hypothetical protein
MKRLATLFFVLSIAVGSIAQQSTSMVSLFKEMPDSLFPYLSHNSRLDMVDFKEAGMKAEVTNSLDGTSELVFLSSDSLSLRLSESLRVEMKLMVGSSAEADSVVQVVRTYMVNENQSVRILDIYSTDWRCLSSKVVRSSLLSRDDELFSQPYF